MTSSVVAAKRAERAAQITATARRLLAEQGPTSLSLRSVARAMEQTPSALYRYFANRDALLTALIIDAYNAIGEEAEHVVERTVGAPPLDRVVAVAKAVRAWALAHPAEYALVYGTPIPNYAAPEATIGPATRTALAFGSIISGLELANVPFGDHPLGSGVLEDETLSVALPGVSADVRARAVLLWSAVFGLITFELFGHFVGSVADSSTYFTAAMTDLARHLGLADV